MHRSAEDPEPATGTETGLNKCNALLELALCLGGKPFGLDRASPGPLALSARLDMTQQLQQKIISRWPKWFDVRGDLRRTLMPWGFCHDDVWFDILWSLFEDLEPLVADWEKQTGRQFEVVEVKEKLGGLRVYVVPDVSLAIRHRIGAAAHESFRTCELCGRPGLLRQDGWLKTLCDGHAEESGRGPAASSG